VSGRRRPGLPFLITLLDKAVPYHEDPALGCPPGVTVRPGLIATTSSVTLDADAQQSLDAEWNLVNMSHHFVIRRIRGPGWQVGKRLREQAQWAEHSAFMDELVEEGFVVIGGVLDDDAGALLVIDAEEEATIRKRLDSDPWSVSGVLGIQTISRWNVLLGRERVRRQGRVG
jgi:uncharacterized protein